jgi:hypothetical protein
MFYHGDLGACYVQKVHKESLSSPACAASELDTFKIEFYLNNI